VLINTKAIFKIFLLLLPLLMQSCVQKETDCILFCAGESKIEFAYSAQSFNEAAGTVSITVSISPAPLNPISVDYEINTNASTATLTSDYNLTTGTLNFAAGQTSANISLTLINDSVAAEGTEYITLRLLNPSSGRLGAKSTTVISVIDNDLSDLTVAEGASIDSAHIDCNDGSGATQFISLLSAGDADANCSLQVTPYFIRCAPTYKSGHSDWSTSVSATCTINGVVNPINIAVNVTNTNRAPTHSGMTPIILATGAKASTATTITYAELLANINGLTDADGDTNFIFRIQSLDNGTMTKNGAGIATGITTIATGESVVWTPNSSAVGAVAAFKVSVGDGMGGFSSTTQVTIDQVMRFPTLSSISTMEQSALTSAIYTSALNGCSNGGSGTPVITIQTYGATLDSAHCSINGSNQLECPTVPNHATAPGNWSETLTIRCTIGDPLLGGMTIDRSQVVNVTNYNQAPVDFPVVTDYQGNLNTNFNITFTDLKSRVETAHGSALLDPDGDAIRFKIIRIEPGVTVRRGATVQAVGSILSATQTWTITPPTNSVGRLPVVELKMIDSNNLESSASEFVYAQVKGFVPLSAITVAEGQSTGNIPLSCYNGESGIITYALGSQSDADSNCSVTGSNLVCSPNYKSTQVNWTSNLVVNCLDNAVLYMSINTHPTPQLTVNVTNVNRLPTLSQANFTGANWDAPFQFTHTELLTQASAADPDADTISFRIKSISTDGVLTRGGTPLVVGNTIVPSDVIRWLPNSTTIGTDVVMFTVAAYDGTDESASSVSVTNDVYGIAPIANISATIGQTYESAELLCANAGGNHSMFTLTTPPPAQANCTIQNNGSNPFIRCTPSAAIASTTVTVTCDATGATRNFTFQSATLQQPPSYSGAVARIDGAVRNTNFTVTYAMLSAATSGVVSDPNGDTIRYRIEYINPAGGSINRAVGDYINVGQSFIWTPPSNTIGVVNLVQFSACDALACSSTSPDFTFGIAGFDPISNLTTSEDVSIESADLNCQSGAYPTPTSLTIHTQSDADANCSIAAGKVSCTPNYKATTSIWTSTITVRCMLDLTPYDQSFTLTVNHTNQAPTMTTISPIGAIDDGSSIFITYDDFKAKTNLADVDPDTHEFIFDSIEITPAEGNLFIDGAPINNGDRLIEGQTLEIRPTTIGSIVTNPTPKLLARVSVTDGAETTSSVDLNFVFVRFEVISDVTASTEGVMVSTDPLDCSDGLGNTPTYDVLFQSTTRANCVINSNVVDCTPNDPTNNDNNWDATIQIQCEIGGATITQNFDLLDVQNVNNAPTFAGLGNIYSAVVNQIKEISYADLVASTAIRSDPEGEALCFKAKTSNGDLFSDLSLTTIVQVDDTLCSGQSWYYNPSTLGATSHVDVIELVVTDLTNDSSPNVLLKVHVVDFGFNVSADATVNNMKEGETNLSTNLFGCDDSETNPVPEIVAQSDDDLRCSIEMAAPNFRISCNPEFKTGNSNWSGTVDISCPFETPVIQQFTIEVDDTNREPIASNVTFSSPTAKSSEAYSITFSDVQAALSDPDEADETNLKYCIVPGSYTDDLTFDPPENYTCGSGNFIDANTDVTFTPNYSDFTVAPPDHLNYVFRIEFRAVDSENVTSSSTYSLNIHSEVSEGRIVASVSSINSGSINLYDSSAVHTVTLTKEGDSQISGFTVNPPKGFYVSDKGGCNDTLINTTGCTYEFKPFLTIDENMQFADMLTVYYHNEYSYYLDALTKFSVIGHATNGVTTTFTPAASLKHNIAIPVAQDIKSYSADIHTSSPSNGFMDYLITSVGEDRFHFFWQDAFVPLNPFYTIATHSSPGIYNHNIISADIDGDGQKEVITYSEETGQYKIIIYQTTIGTPVTFSQVASYNVISDLVDIKVIDFNRDGKVDILMGFQAGASAVITILENQSAGIANYNMVEKDLLGGSIPGENFEQLEVADLNIDGQLDLLLRFKGLGTPATNMGKLVTTLNQSTYDTNGVNYSFAQEEQTVGDEFAEMKLSNLKNSTETTDEWIDVVMLHKKMNEPEYSLTVMQNNRSGQFNYASPIHTYTLNNTVIDSIPNYIPNTLVVADFNRDGFPDILLSQDGIDLLFYENTTGAGSPRVTYNKSFALTIPGEPLKKVEAFKANTGDTGKIDLKYIIETTTDFETNVLYGD
jgi:hypothetical protein